MPCLDPPPPPVHAWWGSATLPQLGTKKGHCGVGSSQHLLSSPAHLSALPVGTRWCCFLGPSCPSCTSPPPTHILCNAHLHYTQCTLPPPHCHRPAHSSPLLGKARVSHPLLPAAGELERKGLPPLSRLVTAEPATAVGKGLWQATHLSCWHHGGAAYRCRHHLESGEAEQSSHTRHLPPSPHGYHTELPVLPLPAAPPGGGSQALPEGPARAWKPGGGRGTPWGRSVGRQPGQLAAAASKQAPGGADCQGCGPSPAPVSAGCSPQSHWSRTAGPAQRHSHQLAEEAPAVCQGTGQSDLGSTHLSGHREPAKEPSLPCGAQSLPGIVPRQAGRRL